jgi:MFS family permease
MDTKKVPEGYLFSKGYTYYIFALVCLLMLTDFADRMIISSLLPLIKAEWKLTDAQSGGLVSAVYWCMFIFVIPISILVDRWSRRKAMFLMSTLWSVACAAGAFVTGYGQFWVTRAFIGIGEAAYAPAAVSTISALFPEKRRAVMIGIFNAFISIGMVVGMMLGAWIAIRWGWRAALGVVALPGFIIAVLIYFVKDYQTIALEQTVKTPVAGSTEEVQKTKLTKAQIVKDFFRKPSLVAAYLSFAAQSFVYVSIITFLPTYYVRVQGVSLQAATTMTSAPIILMIFAGAIGGWAVDRWMLKDLRARMYFPGISYLVSALALIFAFGLFSKGQITYQYSFLLIGFFLLTAAGPACIAVTQEVVHPGVRAMAYGVGLVFQHMLGSAPGPVITGALSDNFGLPFALTCAGGVNLIAAAVMLLGSFYYLKDRDSVEKVTIRPEE